MLASLPVSLIVGSILGFLAGLGVGGGSLLMLWLTMVLGIDAAAAREINLLFFIPSAAVSCLLRWKQGSVPWKKLTGAILFGSATAGLFSGLSAVLDTSLLKKGFGILLIFTGLRELLGNVRKR